MGSLVLTERARPLLRGDERFLLRETRQVSKPSKRSTSAASKVARENQPLFDALSALRLKLAAAAKLPPYVVAQDRTLIELAEKRPTTKAALHDILGLGASKIARYGSAFLETISQFKKHPLLVNRLSPSVNGRSRTSSGPRCRSDRHREKPRSDDDLRAFGRGDRSRTHRVI